jgi:hypothetical protein
VRTLRSLGVVLNCAGRVVRGGPDSLRYHRSCDRRVSRRAQRMQITNHSTSASSNGCRSPRYPTEVLPPGYQNQVLPLSYRIDEY